MSKITRVRMLILALLTLLIAIPIGAQGSVETGVTTAAYQPYEQGFMIWREDTGAVYAFANAGNLAMIFPQSEYENLPDNPVEEPAPDFRIKPVRGFGRVWGNFDEVRFALGWALEPETNFTADFREAPPTAGGLDQVAVNLPGGLNIVIREDNTWGYLGIPRNISSLPATATFPATIQQYEHGYMMWWSETGSIWVLYDDGTAALYNSVDYGALPNNNQQAPEGLVTPIMGFGKVWTNYPQVRTGLGWATEGERGFQLEFQRIAPTSFVGGVALVVSTGNSQDILIRSDNTWRFSG